MGKSRGRTKTKNEKIGTKASLAVAFTKRRYGLFSKASQLCLLSGGQIAVLATPPSSNSSNSFFSFGHSSVDSVVSAFLSGQRPVPVHEEPREEDLGICLARKELGLRSWWEDDALARSENPEELTEAINSMSSLLAKCKELRKGESSFCNEKSEPDQTLIPQSDSPITDEIVAFSPSDQRQILAICDNKDMALDREMDVDQLIDFEAFDTEAMDDWFLESGQMLADDVLTNPYLIPDMAPQNRDLDQDNRRFSDLFNTIAAL